MIRTLCSLVVSLAFLLPLSCLAQQDSSGIAVNGAPLLQSPHFGLGVQAGVSTGAGISLRYLTGSRFGIEGIASYIALDKSFYSLGLELQYTLDRSPTGSRVYVMGGFGYYYYDNDAGANAYKAPTRVGIGPAYDWFVSNTVALTMEVPITAMFVANDKTVVLPLPQVQLVFHFR